MVNHHLLVLLPSRTCDAGQFPDMYFLLRHFSLCFQLHVFTGIIAKQRDTEQLLFRFTALFLYIQSRNIFAVCFCNFHWVSAWLLVSRALPLLSLVTRIYLIIPFSILCKHSTYFWCSSGMIFIPWSCQRLLGDPRLSLSQSRALTTSREFCADEQSTDILWSRCLKHRTWFLFFFSFLVPGGTSNL